MSNLEQRTLILKVIFRLFTLKRFGTQSVVNYQELVLIHVDILNIWLPSKELLIFRMLKILFKLALAISK
jgi:hypothetical protein